MRGEPTHIPPQNCPKLHPKLHSGPQFEPNGNNKLQLPKIFRSYDTDKTSFQALRKLQNGSVQRYHNMKKFTL